jgi:hypothetical protein
MGACGCFISVLRPVFGEGRYRERGGGQVGVCSASRVSWTATGAAGQVVHLQSQSSPILARQVFDRMSARKQFLNFENFLVWVFIILDKYSRNIFGRPRGGVLLKSYLNLGMSYE